MGPNQRLMRLYGTEHVLQEKLAGAGSLIERIGMMLLNEGLLYSNRASDEQAKATHDQEYEARREHELNKIQPAVQALRHTDVPEQMTRLASVGISMGRDLAKTAALFSPTGRGSFGAMVTQPLKRLGGRVAQAGQAAGQAVGQSAATAASRVPGAVKTVGQAASKLPGVGAAGMMGGAALGAGKLMAQHPGAVLGAGVLGAGAVASKAINTGVQALGQGEAGPGTFGGGRFGYQLANGVNAYGQPQLGTPLL